MGKEAKISTLLKLANQNVTMEPIGVILRAIQKLSTILKIMNFSRTMDNEHQDRKIYYRSGWYWYPPDLDKWVSPEGVIQNFINLYYSFRGRNEWCMRKNLR